MVLFQSTRIVEKCYTLMASALHAIDKKKKKKYYIPSTLDYIIESV